MQLNHIEDEDEIKIGQILKIPPKIPANGNHSASSTPPKSTHANANKSTSHGSAHSNGNSHSATSHSSNTKHTTTTTSTSKNSDDTWSWDNLQKQAQNAVTYIKKTANDNLNTVIVFKDKVEGQAEEAYHKIVNGGDDNSSNDGNSQPQDTKIPVNNDRSQENGTPKGVANSVCKTNPACITSGKSELIREVNIRLAGFGGALPTDEFTELTAKCIKQFQRDYMGVAETGKICGSLLVSLDKFRDEYPLDKYATHLKCPCGKCSGFGNGRYGVKSGKNIANEYPGIHRSIAWILKTLQFYLTHEFKSKKLAVELIFSGYRCIDDNIKHSPPYTKKVRTSVNHMGRALDIHFTKNGKHTGETPDMEYIRKNVMAVKMGAIEVRHPDKIYLEPKAYPTTTGAYSWVHYDVTQFTEEKYIRKEDFKKTIEEINGKPLVELVKSFGNSNILGCSGTVVSKPKPVSTQPPSNGKSIGGIIGKVIASHESYGGDYTIFNRGTVGKVAGTQGHDKDIGERTIAEWVKAGEIDANGPNRMQKRLAMGKYQIIPNTLVGLGFSSNTKLTPENQERMFKEGFVKPTKIYTAIISGSDEDIIKATMYIAKTWASVGVPYDTSRYNRKTQHTTYIKKGETYHKGKGNNRAGTSPDLVINALKQMHHDYQTLISQGMSKDQAFDKIMSVDTPLFK